MSVRIQFSLTDKQAEILEKKYGAVGSISKISKHLIEKALYGELVASSFPSGSPEQGSNVNDISEETSVVSVKKEEPKKVVNESEIIIEETPVKPVQEEKKVDTNDDDLIIDVSDFDWTADVEVEPKDDDNEESSEFDSEKYNEIANILGNEVY